MRPCIVTPVKFTLVDKLPERQDKNLSQPKGANVEFFPKVELVPFFRVYWAFKLPFGLDVKEIKKWCVPGLVNRRVLFPSTTHPQQMYIVAIILDRLNNLVIYIYPGKKYRRW